MRKRGVSNNLTFKEHYEEIHRWVCARQVQRQRPQNLPAINTIVSPLRTRRNAGTQKLFEDLAKWYQGLDLGTSRAVDEEGNISSTTATSSEEYEHAGSHPSFMNVL